MLVRDVERTRDFVSDFQLALSYSKADIQINADRELIVTDQ